MQNRISGAIYAEGGTVIYGPDAGWTGTTSCHGKATEDVKYDGIRLSRAERRLNSAESGTRSTGPAFKAFGTR